MGCGSASFNQVHDVNGSGKKPPLPAIQLPSIPFAPSTFFIFGQTMSERKIITFCPDTLHLKTISTRVRIPHVRIRYEAIESIYEQSQEILLTNPHEHEPKPPHNHMLTLMISSQQIFMCGGCNYEEDVVMKDTWFYTMEPNKTNKKFQRGEKMLYNRYCHMGIILNDCILIIGGKNDNRVAINDCQKYMINERKWKECGKMQHPRAKGSVIQFMETVYVFGGQDESEKRLENVQVYHPNKDTWTVLPIKLAHGLIGPYIHPAKSNQILIFGGNTHHNIIRLNIKTQQYCWEGIMAQKQSSVIGFADSIGKVIYFLNQNNYLDEYRIEEKRWKKMQVSYKSFLPVSDVGKFNVARGKVKVNPSEEEKVKISFDERVVMMVGNERCPCLVGLEQQQGEYWMTLQPIPLNFLPYSLMGACSTPKGAFICGGINFCQQHLADTCGMLTNNEFLPYHALPTTLYNFGIAYIEHNAWVFGGCTSKYSNPTDDILILDNNQWKKVGIMKKGKANVRVLPLTDTMCLLVGGHVHDEGLAMLEVLDVKNREIVGMMEVEGVEALREMWVTVGEKVMLDINKKQEQEEEVNYKSERIEEQAPISNINSIKSRLQKKQEEKSAEKLVVEDIDDEENLQFEALVPKSIEQVKKKVRKPKAVEKKPYIQLTLHLYTSQCPHQIAQVHNHTILFSHDPPFLYTHPHKLQNKMRISPGFQYVKVLSPHTFLQQNKVIRVDEVGNSHHYPITNWKQYEGVCNKMSHFTVVNL